MTDKELIKLAHRQAEAMKLALEALYNMVEDGDVTDKRQALEAITALREALAQQALDKKAENARELGLDYEPAKYSDIVSDGGLDPRNKFDKPAQQEPVAWADECRIELVIAIHFLASDFENALGTFGGDTEARRKAEGDIAHARSIASRWNWNGTSPPAQQNPVALKWQQAPIRTAWGDDMVVASVAIDKDHTLSLYCERDQAPKVEAMFAQRTWVGLSDDEVRKICVSECGGYEQARAIEAKLKAKNSL